MRTLAYIAGALVMLLEMAVLGVLAALFGG